MSPVVGDDGWSLDGWTGSPEDSGGPPPEDESEEGTEEVRAEFILFLEPCCSCLEMGESVEIRFK